MEIKEFRAELLNVEIPWYQISLEIINHSIINLFLV